MDPLRGDRHGDEARRRACVSAEAGGRGPGARATRARPRPLIRIRPTPGKGAGAPEPVPGPQTRRGTRGERARRRGAGAAQRVSVYRKSRLCLSEVAAAKKEVTQLLFVLEFISSITQVYHRNDGANAPRPHTKKDR